jgi:hypothetical protein
MALVVKRLPCNLKTPSSNPSTPKNKKVLKYLEMLLKHVEAVYLSLVSLSSHALPM